MKISENSEVLSELNVLMKKMCNIVKKMNIKMAIWKTQHRHSNMNLVFYAI